MKCELLRFEQSIWMDTVYAAMVIIRKYRIKDPIEMVWHPDEQMRLFLSPKLSFECCAMELAIQWYSLGWLWLDSTFQMSVNVIPVQWFQSILWLNSPEGVYVIGKLTLHSERNYGGHFTVYVLFNVISIKYIGCPLVAHKNI